MISRTRHLVAGILVVVTAGSCAASPPGSVVAEQSVCAGISSDMGGGFSS